MNPRTYILFIICLIAIAAFLIAKMPYLEQSLDRDEGTYLFLGQATLEGQTPYVDHYEMKPPGLFYTYAFIRWVVGHSDWAVRWFSHLLIGLNAFLVFVLLLQWKWRWGAIGALISYLIFQMVPYYLSSALLLEPVVLFYFLLSVVLFQMKKGAYVSGLLPGLLLGLAVLTKQNIIFLILGYIIPFLVESIQKRKPIKPLSYVIFGFASVITTAIIVLWYQGAWTDFMYWVFHYPAQVYTQSIPIEKGFTYFWQFFTIAFTSSPVLWMLVLLGVIISLKKGHIVPHKIYVALGLLFGFLSITPGLRFYGHYWLLWLPALSISVGAFAEAIQSLTFLKRPYLIGTLFLIYLCGHIWIYQDRYIQPNILQWERRVYGPNPNYEVKRICEELKALPIDDKDLLILGSEPQAYFYLNIEPVSSHIFLAFLNKRHDRRQNMQEEFTNAIRSSQPKYILFVNYPYSWSITEEDVMDVYDWSRNYISNFYTPIGMYSLDDSYKLTINWSNNPEDLQPMRSNSIWIMKRK